ncbi:hypothetical protein VCV18_007485 [Metarhizium anisopliae]
MTSHAQKNNKSTSGQNGANLDIDAGPILRRMKPFKPQWLGSGVVAQHAPVTLGDVPPISSAYGVVVENNSKAARHLGAVCRHGRAGQ